jgi:hypothetical protein
MLVASNATPTGSDCAGMGAEFSWHLQELSSGACFAGVFSQQEAGLGSGFACIAHAVPQVALEHRTARAPPDVPEAMAIAKRIRANIVAAFNRLTSNIVTRLPIVGFLRPKPQVAVGPVLGGPGLIV